MGGDDRIEEGEAVAAAAAGADSLQAMQVKEPEPVGFLEGALEGAAVGDLGEVEEGAGDGGRGDGVDRGSVGLFEPASAVDSDAAHRASAGPRSGHIDDARIGR